MLEIMECIALGTSEGVPIFPLRACVSTLSSSGVSVPAFSRFDLASGVGKTNVYDEH